MPNIRIYQHTTEYCCCLASDDCLLCVVPARSILFSRILHPPLPIILLQLSQVEYHKFYSSDYCIHSIYFPSSLRSNVCPSFSRPHYLFPSLLPAVTSPLELTSSVSCVATSWLLCIIWILLLFNSVLVMSNSRIINISVSYYISLNRIVSWWYWTYHELWAIHILISTSCFSWLNLWSECFMLDVSPNQFSYDKLNRNIG